MFVLDSKWKRGKKIVNRKGNPKPKPKPSSNPAHFFPHPALAQPAPTPSLSRSQSARSAQLRARSASPSPHHALGPPFPRNGAARPLQPARLSPTDSLGPPVSIFPFPRSTGRVTPPAIPAVVLADIPWVGLPRDPRHPSLNAPAPSLRPCLAISAAQNPSAIAPALLHHPKLPAPPHRSSGAVIRCCRWRSGRAAPSPSTARSHCVEPQGPEAPRRPPLDSSTTAARLHHRSTTPTSLHGRPAQFRASVRTSRLPSPFCACCRGV